MRGAIWKTIERRVGQTAFSKVEKNKYGQRRISHDKMILINSKRSFEVYSPEDLRAFCEECFIKVGVSEEHAKLIADHLIMASLRGVDSHLSLIHI